MIEFTGKSTSNAHGLMLIAILLAATSFPIGAAITNSLPPAVMMLMRFLLAALMFLPYLMLRNTLYIPTTRKMLGYVILSIPLAVFFWCMFEGLRYTNAINTSALYTLVPAITAIYAFLINKEVTQKFRFAGLLIGTLGALWIVFRGNYSALVNLNLNYGDLIFVIGCLFLGLYNPLIKKIYRGEPMEVMTFWVLLCGAGWLLLTSSHQLSDIVWSNVSYKVYAGILYLSLFTTLITFFLLQISVIKIGSTKVAAYGFLTPIFVIAISIALGTDSFDLATLPGIVMVAMAMFIIQYEAKTGVTIKYQV
jgi:drug/metabolite transporter (DMT)-like permease